jgi:hypothetical protein
MANNADRSSHNSEAGEACALITLSSIGLGFTTAKVSFTYTSPDGKDFSFFHSYPFMYRLLLNRKCKNLQLGKSQMISFSNRLDSST